MSKIRVKQTKSGIGRPEKQRYASRSWVEEDSPGKCPRGYAGGSRDVDGCSTSGVV